MKLEFTDFITERFSAEQRIYQPTTIAWYKHHLQGQYCQYILIEDIRWETFYPWYSVEKELNGLKASFLCKEFKWYSRIQLTRCTMLFFNMEKYYVLIYPVAKVFKMLYVLNYYIVW